MRDVDLARGLYIDCGMVISTVSSTGPEVNMGTSSNVPMTTASRSIPISFATSVTRYDQSMSPSNKPTCETYPTHPHDDRRPFSSSDIADRDS